MSDSLSLDFKLLNKAALDDISYLQKILPCGKQKGNEFVAGDIYGGSGESFKINLKNGVWADFATNQSGADIISLIAAQENIAQMEALRHVAAEIGVSPSTLARKNSQLSECPIDWDNPTYIYPYYYPDGRHAFDVLRWERQGYRKAIRQSKGYDERGRRIRHNKGTPPILYNLVKNAARPSVLTSDEVVVVEGENKAEALIDMGICATCNPGGASKWKATYSEYLRGKSVIILPDNDQLGYEHAEQIANSLINVSQSIKIVELPGLPKKGDIIDWLSVPGNDKTCLQNLIQDTPYYKGNKASSVAICVEDFLKLKLKTREYVLYPILQEQGTAMLFAFRGVGKTHLALSIAHAVACGTSLFDLNSGIKWHAPTARKVLYVDGEMPQIEIQQRLSSIVTTSSTRLPRGNFSLITPDQLPVDEFIPNLATPKGQKWLEPCLSGVNFLVLDNLATLFGRQQENTAESWIPIQKWLLSLRKRGLSVLLVHHAGKNGEQRDTSAKEDILDCSIRLRHPEDYSAKDGARFIVELTKARGICGMAALPFEATLSYVDGQAIWSTKEIGDNLINSVVSHYKNGMSMRKTAELLDVSHSLVQRRLEKAKNLGLI